MGKKQARVVKFEQTPSAGKKAAIYVRVSSNEFIVSRHDEKKLKEIQPSIEDKVRQSVTTQRADAIQYCQKQVPPWTHQLYEDNDLSGTLGADERPGLAKLLRDVEQGKIHTILVRDVKRLARNNRILKEIIADYLLPKGVELHGLTDAIKISTPNARFYTSVMAEVAELEVL